MKTVFIGALPFRTTERTIRDLVKSYSPKEGSLEIHADWVNPTFEPYALVTLGEPERAIEDLDGLKIGAYHLRVHLATETKELKNG